LVRLVVAVGPDVVVSSVTIADACPSRAWITPIQDFGTPHLVRPAEDTLHAKVAGKDSLMGQGDSLRILAADWLSQRERRKLDGVLAVLATELRDEPLLVAPAAWDDQQGAVALTTREVWFCSPVGPWAEPLHNIRSLEREPRGTGIALILNDDEETDGDVITVTPRDELAAELIIEIIELARTNPAVALERVREASQSMQTNDVSHRQQTPLTPMVAALAGSGDSSVGGGPRIDEALVQSWAARYLAEPERDRLTPLIVELFEEVSPEDLLCVVGAEQAGEEGLLALDTTRLLFCCVDADEIAEEPLSSVDRVALDPLRGALTVVSDDGFEALFAGFYDPAAAQWFSEVLEASLTSTEDAAVLAARPPGHFSGPGVGIQAIEAAAAPDQIISFVGAVAVDEPGLLAVSETTLLFWSSVANQVSAVGLSQIQSVTADPLRGSIRVDRSDGPQLTFESVGDGVTAEWFCSVIEAATTSVEEALELASEPPDSVLPVGMLWEREHSGNWQLWLEPAVYLGGHPQRSAPVKRAAVWVHEAGVSVLDSAGRTALEFDLEDLKAVEADGPSEVQKRVTVPRILALGVIALAVPKKERLAYLVLDTNAGEAIIEVHSMSAMELRAAIQPLVKLVTTPKTPSPQPSNAKSVTVRDRLLELKSLHDDRLIDDEEHAARRAAILDEI
jgi:hypothetical protein